MRSHLFTLIVTLFISSQTFPVFANVRLDATVGGALEIFAVQEKPELPVNIGTLGGGGVLFGVGAEWHKAGSMGFGLDLGVERFSSNAKLEQEQFGVLEKGTFDLGSTLISATPFAAWHLGENKRLRMGLGYEIGFASQGKLKIGVLDYTQKIEKIARYGVTFGFDTTVWKDLTLGVFGAVKLGKYVGTVTNINTGTDENQDFNFKSYVAAVTLGWRFPVGAQDGWADSGTPNAPISKKPLQPGTSPMIPKGPAKKTMPPR